MSTFFHVSRPLPHVHAAMSFTSVPLCVHRLRVQAELSAAEDRHVDAEAQLVEAEGSASRQLAIARQLQGENERMHAQYGELQVLLLPGQREGGRRAAWLVFGIVQRTAALLHPAHYHAWRAPHGLACSTVRRCKGTWANGLCWPRTCVCRAQASSCLASWYGTSTPAGTTA